MKEPQSNQPAEDRRERPLKKPLPTTPDPALINITEKGRKPKLTRREPGR